MAISKPFDPLAQLESPHYRARVERGVVITVEAFDWNCPKYITPRYTEAESQTMLAKTGVAGTTAAPVLEDEVLGQGALTLTITGMRQLTPRVRAYELRAIHAGWRLGARLAVDAPVNHFPLHADDRPAVLIAGGIGITPIKAMAHALKARGAPFSLHYAARTPADMAFRHHLADRFATESHFYFSDAPAPKRLDLNALLRSAPPQAVLYICGPPCLIEGALQTASILGVDPSLIQFESFI
jgi:hypothetical protein